MNIQELYTMRDALLKKSGRLAKASIESFDKHFELEYTHNSTAIEGNTLSLIEQTKAEVWREGWAVAVN